MSTNGEAGALRRKGVFARLYHGETNFDFVGKRRWWFLISSIVIVAGLISLGVRGLNLGIEFKGGTEWQVPTATVGVQQARDALGPLGMSTAVIETLGTGHNRTLDVQYRISGSQAHQQQVRTEVARLLAKLAHISPSQVSITYVGPTWGSSVTHKAEEALIVFFIVIAAYIAIRFEWKMALAAIVAVIHDLLVTAGVYSLSGLQVTPDTVVAVLTILGYSLYDTIVVFDRVQENAKGLSAQGKLTYTDTVNLSMNQVLARSINTSLVAILPILSILVIGAELLGATTLKDFGFALFIGLTSGAYSSIFIASPLLAVLKEREVQYRRLRERLAASGKAGLLLSPAAAAKSFRPAGSPPSLRRPSPRPVALQPSGAPAPSAGVATGDEPLASLGSARPLTTRPPTSRRASPQKRKGRRR